MTLGEELKRRREERGKTLSAISETTRIGTRFLKAIEENNFSVLPGGIFTRSFIRAYAREVGMDETEATAMYHRQTSPQEIPEAPVPGPKPDTVAAAPSDDLDQDESVERPPLQRVEDPQSFVSRVNWPTVVTVLSILFLVGAVVFVVTQRLNKEEANESQQAATTTQKQPARPGPHAAAPPPNAQPASPVPADSPAVSASSIQVISVSVEATSGDSWVGYQVDDGQSGALLLKQGESKSLPEAHNKVKLNIGNRKALTIKINNHDMTFPPDIPNFSAHVIISRDNLQNYLQNNAAHSF
jgi:cytoskeletal protein RodZ